VKSSGKSSQSLGVEFAEKVAVSPKGRSGNETVGDGIEAPDVFRRHAGANDDRQVRSLFQAAKLV
jgi:hypothetical protein